ncbi:MAG: GTPase Era [Burkholderiales bacterium]|nr:GTPase Era [Burkholderiales bacterium]
MSGFRCGTVAIVGRPNTGKSSLLNRLLGQKIASVSRKAQTTRRSLAGILTTPACQYVFVDLPGYQTRHGGALNRALNRQAAEGARACDVALFVTEALRFGATDREALARIPAEPAVVAAVNKSDLLGRPGELLPFIDRLRKERPFAAIVPVSARTGRNLPELLRAIEAQLPEGPAAYPANQLTDKDERFFAAEILREKLFLLLGDELPYRCEVTIESFREEGAGARRPALRRVEAAIWVEKASQKAIVIGAGGALLKRIATAARRDMERLFGGKVYLGTWVRVRKDWSGDARMLRQLGLG